MPQMAPIKWLMLFMFFSLSFMIFNILNFYCFNFLKTYNKNFLMNNKNSNKILLSLSWKW